MTTNHHVAFPSGFAMTASEFESRVSALDQAITDVESSGSGWAGTLDGTAAAGQKVVPVVSTVGALVGMPVFIGTGAVTPDIGVIASIVDGVSVTMTSNLAYTWAAGTYITATPYEVFAARGAYATMKARLDADDARAVADEANITLLLARHAFLGFRYIFNGTTTYTPTAGAVSAYAELIGGGGGSGSVATAVTNAGASGGGGGAAYSAVWIPVLAASYPCAVGAGGTAGASGAANNGGDGGDTTLGTAGALGVAKGGGGGFGDTIAAGPRIGGSGGLGGAAASGTGDIKMDGAAGTSGLVLAAAQAMAGTGGMAGGPGGGGAKGGKGQGAGSVGGLYGGGASGGVALSGGASVAGAAGGNGLLRIGEYR
jgi:hypothetical protein